jgi:hypothetical protein
MEANDIITEVQNKIYVCLINRHYDIVSDLIVKAYGQIFEVCIGP